MKIPRIDQRKWIHENLPDSCSCTYYPTVRSFFDDWAVSTPEREDYDTCVKKYGYVAPRRLLKKVKRFADPSLGPFVDLGCGTGVSGEPFTREGFTLDGIDVSEGMLAIARRRNIYRRLMKRDVTTDRLDDLVLSYNGLVSSGVIWDYMPSLILDKALKLLSERAVCAFCGSSKTSDTFFATILADNGFTIRN